MAANSIHQTLLGVKVGARRILGVMTFGLTVNRETVDTASWDSTWTTRVSGLASAEFSVSVNDLDNGAVLNNTLGSAGGLLTSLIAGTDVNVEIAPLAASTTIRTIQFPCKVTSWAQNVETSGISKVDASFTSTGAPTSGTSIPTESTTAP